MVQPYFQAEPVTASCHAQRVQGLEWFRPQRKGDKTMAIFDGTVWDVDDYAGRVGNAIKAAVGFTFAVAVYFPKTVISIFTVILLASTIWMFSGSPAPTIQQQIAQHAKHGGTTYWLMQQVGGNPTGFLGVGGYGNKQQEANFESAVRYCNGHKGFTGCKQVMKAANSQTFGY